MPLDAELAPTEWTALDRKHKKGIVLSVCKEILEEQRIDWDEIRGLNKKHETVKVRQRICAFAWEVLSDFMSEGEIATFLGIPRTGFRCSRFGYWRSQDVSPTL